MEFDIKLKPSDLVVEIKKMIRSASLHHPSPLLKTPRREASAGGSSRCLTGPVLLPIQTGLSIKVLRIMLGLARIIFIISFLGLLWCLPQRWSWKCCFCKLYFMPSHVWIWFPIKMTAMQFSMLDRGIYSSSMSRHSEIQWKANNLLISNIKISFSNPVALNRQAWDIFLFYDSKGGIQRKISVSNFPEHFWSN